MTDTPENSAPKSADKSGAKERVAKVIARSGVASRRDAEKMILAGKVAVNGKQIASPALDVASSDKITIDGKPIDAPQETRLWLYYKPLGLVTTEKDEQGRRTIFDEMPEGMPRVLNVGRLDLNSEGLLLLTNDGGLKRRLELPETGWLRKYRVRVNGRPTEQSFEPLRQGITIDGEEFLPMEVSLDRQQGANAWLTVGIREGRNREIRRAMTEIGFQVNRLIRISYGPFRLIDMKAGDVMEVKRRMLRDQLGGLLDDKPAGGEAKPERKERGDRPERGERKDRGDKPRFKRDRDEGGRDDKPRFRKDRDEGGREDRPRKPRTGGFKSHRDEGDRGDRGPRFSKDRGDRPDRGPRGDKPRFNRDRDEGGRDDKPRFRKDREEGGREDRPFRDGPRKPRTGGFKSHRDEGERGDRGPRFSKDRGDRPDRGPRGDKPSFNRDRDDRSGGKFGGKPSGKFGDKARFNRDRDEGGRDDRGGDKPRSGGFKSHGGKPGGKPRSGGFKSHGDARGDRPARSGGFKSHSGKPGGKPGGKPFGGKPFGGKPRGGNRD